MEPVHKVKTAVVGCGMISNIYLMNLTKLFSIIDLVAVCDVSRSSAEEKAKVYGIGQVMTIDEVAADKTIEMVVNLTPPKVHYDVIKTMLLAGKHVFTEKMLTDDFAKAEELVALATEKGLYLGVAPDVVLGAGLQTARHAIEIGLIGRVTSCVAAVARNQSLNSELFGFLRQPGGALPYDVGIYYVAAMLSLLGPMSDVSAFGQEAPPHRAQLLFKGNANEEWTVPGYNLFASTLRFKCGAIGTLLLDGNAAVIDESTFTIYGTEGMLRLGDPNRFDSAVELVRSESGACILPHTHGYNGSSVFPDACGYQQRYGSRGVGAAEMAWALRTGRPNRCSKEYGLHCMEVLHGMGVSAKTGTVFQPKSSFTMRPLASGYYSTMLEGIERGDAERSLIE